MTTQKKANEPWLSEFKGTPGPWKWAYDAQSMRPIGMHNMGGEKVLGALKVYEGLSCISVSKSDAALIKAAPDLLSALLLILSYHDDGNCVLHSEDVALARAAIAAATT